MKFSIEPLLEDLSAKQSAKRRSAARKLRKLAAREAGPQLLFALQSEVNDPRTWETQYQMVMALGECAYAESRPFIEELSHRSFEATMVYVAIGDALVRLSEDKIATVLQLIDKKRHPELIDGALRATAMLRLVPDESAISRILDYASHLPVSDGNRFWIIAACPGWPQKMTQRFLEETAKSDRSDFQEAILLARSAKYISWNPL